MLKKVHMAYSEISCKRHLESDKDVRQHSSIVGWFQCQADSAKLFKLNAFHEKVCKSLTKKISL